MAVDLGGTKWMPVRVCEHLRSNTEGAVAVEINIKISVPLGPTHPSSSFAILESCLVPDASTFAALAKNIAGQLFKLHSTTPGCVPAPQGHGTGFCDGWLHGVWAHQPRALT